MRLYVAIHAHGVALSILPLPQFPTSLISEPSSGRQSCGIEAAMKRTYRHRCAFWCCECAVVVSAGTPLLVSGSTLILPSTSVPLLSYLHPFLFLHRLSTSHS